MKPRALLATGGVLTVFGLLALFADGHLRPVNSQQLQVPPQFGSTDAYWQAKAVAPLSRHHIRLGRPPTAELTSPIDDVPEPDRNRRCVVVPGHWAFFHPVEHHTPRLQASGAAYSSGSIDADRSPLQAFTEDLRDVWVADGGPSPGHGHPPAWIAYDAGTPKVANWYGIDSGSASAYPHGVDGVPTDFQLQGCNNSTTGEDGNWSVLDKRSGIAWVADNQLQCWTFHNDTAYRWYRLFITGNKLGKRTNLAMLQIMGTDGVIAGPTWDIVNDKGVEVASISAPHGWCVTYSGGTLCINAPAGAAFGTGFEARSSGGHSVRFDVVPSGTAPF